MYTLNKNEDRIERARCGPSGEQFFKWDKQVDRLDSKGARVRTYGGNKEEIYFQWLRGRLTV